MQRGGIAESRKPPKCFFFGGGESEKPAVCCMSINKAPAKGFRELELITVAARKRRQRQPAEETDASALQSDGHSIIRLQPSELIDKSNPRPQDRRNGDNIATEDRAGEGASDHCPNKSRCAAVRGLAIHPALLSRRAALLGTHFFNL